MRPLGWCGLGGRLVGGSSAPPVSVRRGRGGGGGWLGRARGRLVGAAVLGAAAACAGVGLLATAAWLISRAAERPGAAAVGLAIAGVQFFALARAVGRYGGRLAGHDAAFRALAALRVALYERLVPLAPAGLPAFRDGDLLARLVRDTDALQE